MPSKLWVVGSNPARITEIIQLIINNLDNRLIFFLPHSCSHDGTIIGQFWSILLSFGQ